MHDIILFGLISKRLVIRFISGDSCLLMFRDYPRTSSGCSGATLNIIWAGIAGRQNAHLISILLGISRMSAMGGPNLWGGGNSPLNLA